MCYYDKKKNTWLLVHMEYLFSCSTRHLTRERYRVELSKRNSISTCARGLFSISIAFNLICNNICNRTARKAQFYWIISIVNCAIFFTSNDSNGRENTFKHIWWVISESILLATCFLLPFNRILCPEEKTFKCKKWITDAKRFEPLLALLYMDHNFEISF